MEKKIEDVLLPPFYCKENESYVETLKYKLKMYGEFLDKPDFKSILKKDDVKEIHQISNYILESINKYLSGDSGSSYKTIENVLKSFDSDFSRIAYNLDGQKSLIRIRQSSTNLHDRKDLFHIPFSQRHRVAKQRFSIEGLPCLYLAACSYTAWLELNKPNFNDLWASAFRASRCIPVFDLSFTITNLQIDSNTRIENKEEILSKLKLFPFVLATSFRVKFPNSFFHEEYILSGILLQWIVNNTKYKGIRFLSTKLESYKNGDHLWCSSNFVFPPNKFKIGEEYNKFLCQSFKITRPQNWSVLLNYSNAGDVNAEGEVTAFGISESYYFENTQDISEMENKFVESIDELMFSGYRASKFYNVDGYLSKKFMLDYIE